jgi:uncharacterized protein (DUF885 family)
MWGRLQIERLRERALAKGISERALHDTLLGLGSVSVPLVADELGRRLISEATTADIRQD